jgi:hypothetical protein
MAVVKRMLIVTNLFGDCWSMWSAGLDVSVDVGCSDVAERLWKSVDELVSQTPA